MVTLRKAQQDFVSGFNTWLEQTEPNYLKSTKESFKALPIDRRSEKPIEQRIGKPRLFDINVNKPKFVKHEYFGAQTQGVTYEYDLVIAYPKSDRWVDAMHDDYILIKFKLASSPPSVTGVAYTRMTDEVEFIETEDDWNFSKYKIQVLFDVTPS